MHECSMLHIIFNSVDNLHLERKSIMYRLSGEKKWLTKNICLFLYWYLNLSLYTLRVGMCVSVCAAMLAHKPDWTSLTFIFFILKWCKRCLQKKSINLNWKRFAGQRKKNFQLLIFSIEFIVRKRKSIRKCELSKEVNICWTSLFS